MWYPRNHSNSLDFFGPHGAAGDAEVVEPGVEAFLRKVLLETLRQVCPVFAAVGDKNSSVSSGGHFQRTVYHYCQTASRARLDRVTRASSIHYMPTTSAGSHVDRSQDNGRSPNLLEVRQQRTRCRSGVSHSVLVLPDIQ